MRRDALLAQVNHRQRDVKRLNVVLTICEGEHRPPHFPDEWPLGLGSEKDGQAWWRGCPEGSDIPRCHAVLSKVSLATAETFAGASKTTCETVAFYYWVRTQPVSLCTLHQNDEPVDLYFTTSSA